MRSLTITGDFFTYYYFRLLHKREILSLIASVGQRSRLHITKSILNKFGMNLTFTGNS